MQAEIAAQSGVTHQEGIPSTAASARRAGFALEALTLGRQLPTILVALLTPAALVALAMGLWRVGQDLNWASAYPITSGFFSHWQVWIALSIGLKTLSSSLLAWDSRTRKLGTNTAREAL